MCDVKVDGFKASDIISKLSTVLSGFTDAERAAHVKKTGAIFELRITNGQKQEGVWTIDLKNKGSVYKGPVQAPAKPGVTVLMSDETFGQIADGKLDGQRAFMTGKLKTRGNVMLGTKLSGVLEIAKTKAKL